MKETILDFELQKVNECLQAWDDVACVLNQFIQISNFPAILEFIQQVHFKVLQLITDSHVLEER